MLSTKSKANLYVNQVYFVSCHIYFLFYLNTQGPIMASNKIAYSFNHCLPFMTIKTQGLLVNLAPSDSCLRDVI